MFTTDSNSKDEPRYANPAKASDHVPFRLVRKLVVFVIGMSVLIVGIAMIILPGPATVVIPIGLTILATEFLWAQRWLAYFKRRAQDVVKWPHGQRPKQNEYETDSANASH